jgi:hypothetical protein
MPFNFLAVVVAALVPIFVGMIWYNPKVFGNTWMKESGMTEEKARQANMFKIFGLCLVYSFMLAVMMPVLTIHQFGPLGMIGGPDFIETAQPSYEAFMADYGDAFRTFKHGALHGFMSGLFLALPIIAIGSLFEQRSWKYIAISAGYWTVVMTLMGGIVCGWV